MNSPFRLLVQAVFGLLFAASAFGYYDPVQGRWLSRDPEGESGGFNLYAYCGNDPVNRSDYLGMQPLSTCAPTDEQIAKQIQEIKGLLDDKRAAALRKNETDAIGWRPNRFVKWGTTEEWGALDFLQNVQKARKELGPNGYGTLQMSSVLNRTFGDIDEEILGYFTPKGGYTTSANMRENGRIISGIAAKTAVLSMAFIGVEEFAIAGFSRTGSNAAATQTTGPLRNVLQFQGMEVRAVRDLSHIDTATLEAMQQYGFAPATVNGDSTVLHHLEQNAAGPLVEMPLTNHSIWNEAQHPLGNAPGVGLSDAERAAYDSWRTAYWKWRATQELNVRRILGE